MPPAAKDACVILLDLKVTSRPSAMHALSEVLLYKQLSQSKDECKLFLVNSAQTSNPAGHDGIMSLDTAANIDTLLEEMSAIETGQSDWLEALDVAVLELENCATSNPVTSQILFITDLCSFERPNNGRLMDKLISDINKYDIFLYVIGPSIDPPRTIFSHLDVVLWMADLQVDKDSSNLKIMKKIVNKTPFSVMCSYHIGVNLFHSYKYHKGMQPWQVPLTFGTLMSMPVSTLRLTKREPPFKLKSTASRSYGNEKWAYEDQQDVIIDFHDTVSGLIKHGKFVRIESDGRFKIEGPRSFKALGFTEAKNVPEYLLQSDGSYLVIPDQTQPYEYVKFFNALVEELEESKVYLLVRRVYNKDFNPKFGVLIPRTDLNMKGFVLCQLPYADDIAHDYKEQDITSAPSVEPDQKIFEFLENIDLGSEKCKLKVPLSPTMMVYSSAMDIINKVKEKYIDEQYLNKKFDKLPNEEINFENLKSEWPARQLEKVKKEENIPTDFDDVDDFNFS